MAAEKSNCILHDEAIQKAVSVDKKPVKWLQLSKMAHRGYSAKLPGPQSSRLASEKGSSSSSLSGSKMTTSSGKRGRGKKF